MKNVLIQFLKSQKNKRVETKRMEEEVIRCIGQERYWQQGGYIAFTEIIVELVKVGKIRPIKAWKQNGMSPSLYNGYQILSDNKRLDADRKQILLTKYHPSIHTSHYIQHPDDYQTDEPYMSTLNDFLKRKDQESIPFMSVHERSFQLFYNEKWLTSKEGRKVLQRTGLDWENLNCYPTNEPFFYYQRPVDCLQDPVYVLIIENKDTFFSMKQLFQEECYTWDGKAFGLLIYGEGHKIEKSFSFFWELADFQNRDVTFYYFGDLDPEGIFIWDQLNKTADYEIRPFCFFYEYVVHHFEKIAPKRTKQQQDHQEANARFLSHFPNDFAERIKQLLDSGRYLPQEALNIQRLKRLSQSQ